MIYRRINWKLLFSITTYYVEVSPSLKFKNTVQDVTFQPMPSSIVLFFIIKSSTSKPSTKKESNEVQKYEGSSLPLHSWLPLEPRIKSATLFSFGGSQTKLQVAIVSLKPSSILNWVLVFFKFTGNIAHLTKK